MSRAPKPPPIPPRGESPASPRSRQSTTGEALPRPRRASWGKRLLHGFGGDATAFSISAAAHTILLIALAYLVFSDDARQRLAIVVSPVTDQEELEPVDDSALIPNLNAEQSEPSLLQPLPAEISFPSTDITSPMEVQTVEEAANQPADLLREVPLESLLRRSHATLGGGFEGRTLAQRARLVAERGGTAESEDAVERGLAWLAAHQRQDGGWHLNHQAGPCDSRCGDPGTVGTSTGATALALLPFLGAGYTHQEGKYQDVVSRGLYYLTSRMLETRLGGDFQEGTMYAQGLSAIALCEAYAMTDDEGLKPYAQKAIDFICNAQHPRGGWRYTPGAPGDTTVTGWQVMALKSARMARLFVPSHVIELAKQYLNSVQDSGGAFYGYTESRKDAGPTAVGLLLRMYLGWTRDDPRLNRGALYLSATRPSNRDMYFNYYATQVLHHRGGSEWDGWNLKMREHLIRTQARGGHEDGSWFFRDPHGSVGGRLYTTAICAMILEVYYRHMPLYGDAAVDEEL